MTFDVLLNPKKPTLKGRVRRVSQMSDAEWAQTLAERAIGRAKQSEAMQRRWAKFYAERGE